MDRAAVATTIVIPTHDRARLLAATLSSVREQSLAPAETIVVDDGSTDGTAALLAEAGVTTIVNPGGGWGPGRARNAGLERVTTPLVAFLDSDDLLRPDALRLLTAALTADPAAPFAFGQALAATKEPGGWRPDGLIVPDPRELTDPLAGLYARNWVPSPAVVARTEAVVAVGGFDPSVTWAEDHHLWLRLAERGAPAYVPEVTAVYRLHGATRHYTPTVSGSGERAFQELAGSDPRLAAAVPERAGVQLAEIALGAARDRRGRALAAVLRDGLLRQPRRPTVLRRAGSHLAARRRWAAMGAERWDSDPELREWLASY